MLTILKIAATMHKVEDKTKPSQEKLKKQYTKVLPGLRDAIDVSTSIKDDMKISQLRVQGHLLESVMKGDWQEEDESRNRLRVAFVEDLLYYCTLGIPYYCSPDLKLYDSKYKMDVAKLAQNAFPDCQIRPSLRDLCFTEKSASTTDSDETMFRRSISCISSANGNLDEHAQDLRRTPLPTFKYLADKFHIELETEWELRRFALSGMLLYLQWLKETDDQTAMENEKDEEDEHPDRDKPSRKADLAMQAICQFVRVTNEPGVWDIFITKLAELYQYLNQPEKAEATYRRYWQLNPQNPNAPKFLYNFLKSSGESHTKLIEVLQDIVTKQPSDSLVVDYIQLLLGSVPQSPESSHSVCLHHLFRLLDYPSSGQELPPWELFVNLLKSVLNSKEESELVSVRECWTERESWWPAQYFSRRNLKTTKSPQLQTLRAISAIYLQGKGKSFESSTSVRIDQECRLPPEILAHTRSHSTM
ncbi:putative TATA box-binding protein-associated factor RNA polymerase I subunit A-like [Apostichopus japonicus]|uniref:Putative TATA box-binding protein-associated factor RNA polymerase I subunit A-like n=1 Tax=Stichopus japonicus TaxID=307972 RepID=A0A2G8JTT7_STIJA|nr:putative TATA box-binding protein-associated factor RNA polymerase I subunit A-like [Apostichopus japonicus]